MDSAPTKEQIYESVNAGLGQLKGLLGSLEFDPALDVDEKKAITTPDRDNLIKIVDAVQKKAKKNADSFSAWVLAFLIHWKNTGKKNFKLIEATATLEIEVPPHKKSEIKFNPTKLGSVKEYLSAIEAKLTKCTVFDLNEYKILFALGKLHGFLKV
jgi:hypothetical protein